MSNTNTFWLTALLCIGALTLTGCSGNTVNPDYNTEGYEGRKILVIHSYHPEVKSVINKNAGLTSVLDKTDVEYQTIYMDTKRNTGEAFKKAAALQAIETIEQYRPNVVITFDDNAFKYLIMPYYKDSEMPVVFAGLDWDASVYGAPYTNTTGMVSVTLTKQLIGHLEKYAAGTRVGWLGHDSLTTRKELKAYKEILKLDMAVSYVSDFQEWQESFLELQNEVDIIIHSGSLIEGVRDWDDDAAKRFVLDNITVPIGTVNRPIMSCSVFGLAKVLNEQGVWAAQTALRILDGTKPSDIPQVTNKEAVIIVNLDLAEKLNIIIPPEVLKNAEIYE